MILVKQQVKGSEVVEYLKTEAAYRVVDLCPEAAEYLRKFVGNRNGLLFPSRKRTTPVSYRSFLKRYLTPSMEKLGIKEPGKAAHAFRRFRSSRKNSRFRVKSAESVPPWLKPALILLALCGS